MVGRRTSYTVSPEQTDRAQQQQPKPDDDFADINIDDWFGPDGATAQARASPENTSCWRRYLKWIVLATFVIVGLTIGISLLVLRTANPFAYFVQEDPPGKTEATPWRTQGRTGLRINVMNALEERWTPAFDRYVQEWDNGNPDALTLSTTRVERDIECSPVSGRIKVCNGDYGRTDWRGINIITTRNNWAVNSVAKLNDYHLNRESQAQKLYTMCHELGHAFGLPHTDENYRNRNRGDCLDYTLRPGSNLSPGQFNFDVLAQLYGTVDGGDSTSSGSSSSPGGTSSTSPPRPPPPEEEEEEEEDEGDRAIRRLGDPGKSLPCEQNDEELQLLPPSFIQDSYASVVSQLEVMSCEELYADRSGQNVRMLHQHMHGEGCEIELGYDGTNVYSIQVYKLRVL